MILISTPALAAIIQRQNFDGGVGGFIDFDSDLISTSYLLRVLSRANLVNDVSGYAVGYLLEQQNTDGSWSLQDNPNRIETTAIVVNALWLYRQSYQLSDALSNGVVYLVSQRSTDNLWDEVEGSALALSAILNVEVDRSAYQTSLTNFANLQNNDGSFGDDVYLTALGLRVLDAAEKPAPDEIVLSGRVVDGDTGLPLSNTQVALDGPVTLNQLTDSNGVFSWQGIQAGNYQLALSLSGYNTLNTDTTLQVGDKRNFGDLTLIRSLASPTTGTILGTVTDATDGSALEGVTITVAGVSQVVTTNTSGQFQLNDIPPGAVSIRAALSGYSSVVSNADIVAGQTLIFSPAMNALTDVQVVIAGVVTDRDTGQPLENVLIRVQGEGNDAQASTDASGSYEITGLQAGDLTVGASLTGYQTVSGNVTAPANARINFSPSLVLEGTPPEPVTNSGIIGRVIDRISGLPLSGANISLVLNSDTQSLASGADGEFALSNLSAGTAQLSVSFTGYQTITTTIELPENIILNIGDVTLLPDGVQETAAVRGIVVDSRTNEPLAGVAINGQFASGNVNLVTDASGAFEFIDLLDTEGELVFTLEAYNTVNFGLQLTLNETLDIGQVRLRPEEVVELIPDLAVQNLSTAAVNTNLQTLAIDGSVSVSVRNQGNAEVNLPTNALAFYDVDDNNTFDPGIDQILGQVTLPDTIAVDEDVSLTISVSGTLPFRDAPIHVWVDSDQTLIETDEDNNITSTADQCSQQVNCNLLGDDFNDGDAANWAEIPNQIGNTNAWNVSNGVYDSGISAQGGAAFTGDTDWTDYIAETRLQFPVAATNDAGLLFRYQDVNNWYQFRIKNGQARIISRINGVIDAGVQSATVTVETNRWYTLRVNLQGSRVQAYLDDELIFDFDGLQLDRGAVGYLDDGVYVQYDDLCVSTTTLFDPVVKWHWQGSSVGGLGNRVYGPVTVGQLTDDNNDGVIDFNDTPDVIFASFGGFSALNAVNGSDGTEIWSTRDFDISRFGSTAIADIDGDSIVEIVIISDTSSELFAFEHDGSLKWRVPSGGPGRNPRDAIAIADLDGDGSPEIIHGRRVHSADGTLLWQGSGGRGDNSNYGYLPTVADINLDGSPEVIAGHTIYSADGDIIWNRTDIIGDGYTAIGNFDEDDFAEIVVVTFGRVYLLEHTGETIWGPIGLPGGGFGGAPTISDLDGDGQPEIGVAGARNYIALETDGSIRWTSPTQDTSSSRTGSSVFDFNGDGRVEILYGDELFFRIYDGISGEVLFETENGSATTLEYPIVADIDGDNSAEIVITSSNSQTIGVRVFESSSGSWANTRRIWNQHTYHINNINEDGTIPLQEEPSWLSHNTYRLNTFPGRNVLALPDLTVSQLRVVDPSGGQPLSLSARIGNGGDARSLSGIAVGFYNGNPSTGGVLLAEQTLPIIEPGQYIDISADNITGISANDDIFVVVDPDNEMEECREDNNQMSVVALGLLGEIGLNLNGTVFGSNTDIDLASQVTNNGSLEGSYTVALNILASRTEVASVAAFDVTSLLSTESTDFSNPWNTGATVSGNYIAQATLFDMNGNVLDTAEANFTISDLLNIDGTPSGTPAAALRATTDRPLYHVDDQVQLDALAENITSIHLITDPRLLMVVTDASGSELFNEAAALSSLAPGQIAEAMRALTLIQATEGVYQYQVTLFGDDELGNIDITFAIAMATFEVINDPNAAIRGTVVVQEPEISQGDSQACTFTTLNTGTQNLSALAVNYRVLNVDAQTTVTNDSASLNLAAGASTNQLQSFSSDSFAPGNYACVLETTLDSELRTLAYGQFTVTGAAPTIDILADFQVSNTPRMLVLVDPLEETCTANRSVTLETEFDRAIGDDSEVSVEFYGKSQSKDNEQARPADFAGDMPVDEVNENAGPVDGAITSLTNERLTVRLSNDDALIGRYRIIYYVKGGGRYSPSEREYIDFSCGEPLSIGQVFGEFTVVDTDNVELLAANDDKYADNEPTEIPALETQRVVLEKLLEDRAYTLVDTIDDFTAELLSGHYQQYLLLSELQSLDKTTAKVLREAVNRSEGLIYAGGRAPKYESLQSVLGIESDSYYYQGKGKSKSKGKGKSKGKYKYSTDNPLKADGVRFADTPLAAANDVYFGLDRLLPQVSDTVATVAGTLLNAEITDRSGKKSKKSKKGKGKGKKSKKDDKYCEKGYRYSKYCPPDSDNAPIVTYVDYGQGNAIFIGYDVLAEATYLGLDASVNHHAELLVNSLNYTTPDADIIGEPQHPDSVVPVQLTLENLGAATPLTATIIWPLGSQLLDAQPATHSEDSQFTWSFDLAVDQTQLLTTWAIPEYTNSTAQVVADIYTGEEGSQQLYQTLDISLAASTPETLAAIQEDLAQLREQITDKDSEKALKKVAYSLDKAQRYYDKSRWRKAFERLLEATDYLTTTDNPDVAALRLRIDQLLWQWGQELDLEGDY